MAVLEGVFDPLQPVVVVATPNAISIHDVGIGTLLTVGFPNGCGQRLAALFGPLAYLGSPEVAAVGVVRLACRGDPELAPSAGAWVTL
jgi:hypothetical protein